MSEPNAESERTFVVEGVFEIAGRGPVVTQSEDDAQRSWAAGERWHLGDVVTCEHLRAVIMGIERFCVPPSHPKHYDGALLLRGVDRSDLAPGQVWRPAPNDGSDTDAG